MDVFWKNKRERRLLDKNPVISINGKVYRILNIDERGAGFLIDSPQDIKITAVVEPTIDQNKSAGRAPRIPRFISLFNPPNRRLLFKTAWICGPAFSTRYDPDARKLLQEFIAENIYHDVGITEK